MLCNGTEHTIRGGDSLNTIIRLDQIEKHFDRETVIHQLSMSIYEGEFLTLLGPSGCGKTTLLRLIAGFETPSAGEIYLDGQSLKDKPPYERDMNMVFQQYALFPHMNVEDNILFGLRIKNVPRKEQEERLQEVLAYTKLSDFRKRKPNQLSGGQQQRVAIARAIINNPKVLLLDEPLGALDYQLRKSLQLELKSLQQRLGITFIYVTHDQEEALMLSDRIIIMNHGRIEQIGTPREIYHTPRTMFAANFIGENNVFRKGDIHFCVRPENIHIQSQELTSRNVAESNHQQVAFSKQEPAQYTTKPPKKQGVVRESVFTGNLNKVYISPKGEDTAVIIVYDDNKNKNQWKRDDEVNLFWASEDEVIFQ